MDEVNECDTKRRLKKALVIMSMGIIFLLSFLIFFDFFISCIGAVIFSIIYASLWLFAHFFLREERKSYPKLLYYGQILFYSSFVAWWLLHVLSGCSCNAHSSYMSDPLVGTADTWDYTYDYQMLAKVYLPVKVYLFGSSILKK